MPCRRLFLTVALAVPAAIMLSSCATNVAGRSTRVSYNNGVKVAGVVTYRERIALPENASVRVRLLDTTSETAPPVTLAEQTITKPGQVPIPFIIVIDPAKVDQNHTYAVEAEIAVGNRAVWVTTARQSAITRGSPTTGLTVWVEEPRQPATPKPRQ
jgi:putative lipoprotein